MQKSFTQEDIIREFEKTKQVYITAPERILSDFRKEKENLVGYRGREILELLQNAVDELEENSNAAIEISIKGNLLKVCNNGKPFSFEGFQSLIYSNFSPKYEKDNYIGNKGTGFRSILNWAEKIKIYSGNLAVEFSEDKANSLLEELQKHDSVKEFCRKNNDVHIATLAVPAPIEKNAAMPFDTVIEISLKENMSDKVSNQLKEITPETILFLPKLKTLTIINNDYTKIFEKTVVNIESNEKQDVLIVTRENDNLAESEKWTVVGRQDKYKNKMYNVKAAWRDDCKPLSDNRLYCFFRTKIPMPINVLVHATLDLTADRNSLVESDDNVFILNILCDLIADLGESLCVPGEASYKALEFLSPVGDFQQTLEWDGFSWDSYYTKIAAKKIFPTVNNKYISFEDQPKFYTEKFAKFLRGTPAEHLLQHTSNSKISKFIHEIAKITNNSLEYEYKDIVRAVEFVLPDLSLDDRAALCLMFINKFSQKIKDPVPRFTLDENGNLVDSDTKLFFPPEKENMKFPDLPKFAKMVFLNRDLLKAFQNLPELKNPNLDKLYEKLSPLKNIHQYRLDEIINFAQNALQNIPENEENTFQIEFLSWLWQLYQLGYLRNNSSALPNFVAFPDRENIMKKSSSLYLGADYGNHVTENLYPGQTEKFAGKLAFLENKDPNEVKNFLRLLGIREFPQIVKRKITLSNNKNYKKYLIENIEVPLNIVEYPETYNTKHEIENARFSSVEVTVIDGLDEILTASPTVAILNWIQSDSELKKALLGKYENSTSKGYIRKGQQINDRIIPGQCLASYIRYVFATSKWIEIDGVRYAPYQCLLSGEIGTNFAPKLVTPDLKSFIPVSKNNDIFFIRSLRELLEELGASSDYASLDTETFYTLLLELPLKDKEGKISRSIYRNLLNKKGLSRKLDKNNPTYKKFLQEGKVYCKSTGQFESIGEVKYLQENISNTLQKRFKLIDIYIRQHSGLIQEYFGVLPLSVKGEIEGIPEFHPANAEFKADFREFLPYAFCIRLKQLESEAAVKQEGYENLAAKFKNIDVDICKKALVKYGEEYFELEENTFLIANDKIYLCAPKNCNCLAALKQNIKFCSAIAEIFRSRSGSQDDSIYIFVRTAFGYTPDQRNELILEDFGSLEVLERPRGLLQMTATIKERFIAACTHFNGEKCGDQLQAQIDKLCFSDLSAINNAPHLIELLKLLKINISDFNAQSGFYLDLTPWYEKQLEKLCSENKKAYKNGLFASMQTKTMAEKKKFKEILNRYGISAFDIKNDVYYDCHEVFTAQFGKYLELDTTKDAGEFWQDNLAKFKKTRDESIINELLGDPVFDSMLYFGEEAELEEIYQQKKRENDSQRTCGDSISDIDINQIETTRVTPCIPIEICQSKSTQHGHNSTGFTKNSNREERGAKAEEIVYYKMLLYPNLYKNVEWVSENAKKWNINPDGEAGAGYDLKYIDEMGNEKFVEVKSSRGSEIVFIMSNNELDVAEKNPDKYEIWFVASIQDNPKVQIISDLFKYEQGEYRLNNNKFSCSAEQWTIRCQNDDKKNRNQ